LTKIGHPKQDDLSLGYFYETAEGMTPEESGEVYGHVRSEIDKRLSIFPYNFSMSDGLLYLDYSIDEVKESNLQVTQSEIT